jgi:large subunit ribosomal protein L16
MANRTYQPQGTYARNSWQETQARVKSNQLESARKVVSRTLTKAGKYWIRIFPDRPFTAKAAEVGMGKGKGDPKGYCFEVFPGRIIFEVDGVEESIAKEALRKAGTKLPMKTRIISREHKQ